MNDKYRRLQAVDGRPVSLDEAVTIWTCVVARAVLDSQLAPSRPDAPGENAPTDEERIEAWRFLTDQEGEWAESREVVSEAAGMDADNVREYVVRHFSEPEPGKPGKSEMAFKIMRIGFDCGRDGRLAVV